MDRQSVEVGQRFERLGRWRRIWEVESIIQGAGRITNVVLRDLADPANKCTLGPQVLLDSSRFRPVGQGTAQPCARPLRRKTRSSMKLPFGGHAENRVVDLPRRRLEPSMMIESRSPDGYVIICKLHDQDHKFLAKHPGVDLACPRCGNKARSMALLLDFIGAASPARPTAGPSGRQAVVRALREGGRRLGSVPRAEPVRPRPALILAHPRKPGPA